MQIALEEARAAAARGEVPVGCVIVRDGEVIARAGNRTLPTAIPPRTPNCWRSGRPRPRSAPSGLPTAISMSRWSPARCAPPRCRSRASAGFISAPAIRRAGRWKTACGFLRAPTCHHRPEVYGGINESECAGLLRDFFAGAALARRSCRPACPCRAAAGPARPRVVVALMGRLRRPPLWRRSGLGIDDLNAKAARALMEVYLMARRSYRPGVNFARRDCAKPGRVRKGFVDFRNGQRGTTAMRCARIPTPCRRAGGSSRPWPARIRLSRCRRARAR